MRVIARSVRREFKLTWVGELGFQERKVAKRINVIDAYLISIVIPVIFLVSEPYPLEAREQSLQNCLASQRNLAFLQQPARSGALRTENVETET